MAFAGVYFEDDEKKCAVILTKPAIGKTQTIHERSPLCLTREQSTTWISAKHFSKISDNAINNFDVSMIDFHAVSPRVNSTINNDLELTTKNFL